ncbi:hypothetical protein [Marinobacterium lutimaris]|uniref:Phage tail tube protein n=1 Tax=Marinobacterium lutimaris TaxID=568106 RepID=A0A1H5Y8K8_9GAMM|nr:hypothetical protein [Marinobacterium lutimaris]SEG20353.1 hypothetical protein SAMN05444390_1011662 [Marinobacterium lutimaris]
MPDEIIPTEGSRFFIRNEAGTEDIEFEQHDGFTPPAQTRNEKDRSVLKGGVEGVGFGILRTGEASLTYFVKASADAIAEAKTAFDDVTDRVFTWMWPNGYAQQWTVGFKRDPITPSENVEVDADMKATLEMRMKTKTLEIPAFEPLTGA